MGRFVAVASWHCIQMARQFFRLKITESTLPIFPMTQQHPQVSAALPAESAIVTGATSQIATFLLPRLTKAGYTLHALSRTLKNQDSLTHPSPRGEGLNQSHPKTSGQPQVIWHRVDIKHGEVPNVTAETLIHLAPLPLLPPLLKNLPEGSLKRVIAFGSTSQFSKANSGDPNERAFARALADAEATIAEYCEPHGIAWTVFRPTLIYGCGLDKNITVITRFIRRFRFFPVIGDAQGLRQPVHADDLAGACLAIMDRPDAFNRAYDLSGGEILSYRAMVERIFAAEGIQLRFLRIPLPLFQMAMEAASWLPMYRHLSGEMASRMAMDLCFDHASASQAFGYAPRPFEPPDL